MLFGSLPQPIAASRGNSALAGTRPLLQAGFQSSADEFDPRIAAVLSADRQSS